MLMIIGSIVLLVAGVLGLVILINAFKESAAQGLLCMFVPFYMFYFAFARYSGSKKGVVVGSWVGALVVGIALQVTGAVMAANDAVADFNAEMAQLDTDFANPPAAAAQADEGDARIVSCNLSEQPGRLCNEYSLGSSYTEENASQHCEMVQMMADDKVGLAEGPCPTDNAIGRCEPRFGSQTTVYYRDPDPGIDEDQAMASAEQLCTGTFTRL